MLNEIAKAFGSLTTSPFDKAVEQAHRQARAYLEKGGGVGSKRIGADDDSKSFLVPTDIKPTDMARAIDEKLHGIRGSRLDRPVEAASALVDEKGRVIVAAEYVRHVGDGDLDRGRRYLERVISSLRDNRILARIRAYHV